MVGLREFVDEVRRVRSADVVDVTRRVSPDYETAAIITKLEDHGRSPLVRFHDVDGTRWPVVTSVCGSLGRLAIALGCPVKDVASVFSERAEHPVPPELVRDGPCREVVREADAVDLHELPRLRYHADDAQHPYITAAVVVARDPETQKTNLSYHRLMVAGRDRTGIFIERGRHLDAIFAKYVAAGRDMPVAAFVGVHPTCSLGALYSGSADVEEYDVIGALQQAPLAVVPSLTHPELPVPAEAELVLEGEVSHTLRMREGPFGEFTGYGTGQTESPVLQVRTLTHRNDPWFQDIVSGRMEHLILSVPALHHRTLRDATAIAPGVERVAMVAPLTAVIALTKRDDDEPRRLIHALLAADIYTKHIIVVDADVDPSDLRQVMAAMALQTQADQHVHVLLGMQGTLLDPSCPSADGKGAKFGIDATRPIRPRRDVTRNRIPSAVLDAIDVREILGKR